MVQKCGDFGGKRTDGEPCGKVAGWGVPNETTGKCRRCRRMGGGRPIIHGRYSKYRSKLAERAEGFMDVENPLDLRRELAIARQILDDVLANSDDQQLDEKSVAMLGGCLSTIRKTVESHERVRASQAFTNAEYQNVIHACVAMFEFIPEEKKVEAMEHLKALAGIRPMTPAARALAAE